MWQIMWLFSLLPDVVYHLLLIVGLLAFAASYLLKMVPFFVTNAYAIRIASLTLIIFCIWIEGGIAVEAKWRARVAELEVRVAKAEREAAEANGRIQTVYVDRVNTVKEIQYVTVDKIAKNATKIDKTCVLDPEAISILNGAAHPGAKR